MAVTTYQETFETTTDAFNAHDLERLAELLADDVVFRAPGEIAGEGKADCLRFYEGWFNDFPDAQLEVHALYVMDEVAVEEGTFTGTHEGAGRTGHAVELHYVQVLRFCEGKQVAVKLMFDRLHMLEQLGLSAG
jgi:ketosteroid isomerase-like protein